MKLFFVVVNRLNANTINYMFFRLPRWCKEHINWLSLWYNRLFLFRLYKYDNFKRSCAWHQFFHIFTLFFYERKLRKSKCLQPFDHWCKTLSYLKNHWIFIMESWRVIDYALESALTFISFSNQVYSFQKIWVKFCFLSGLIKLSFM